MKFTKGRLQRLIKAVEITLLLVGGVVGLGILIDKYDAWETDKHSRWPTVWGNVLSAERETRGDYDDEYTVVNIRFGYSVNGVTYQASQDMNVEEETKYPQGNSVVVHYDSAKPRRSFVDETRYISPTDWIVMVSVYPFIAAVVGLIYIWGWWAWH